jgi:hypothetical protein
MKILPFSVATAKNFPSGEYLTVVGRFFSLSNYFYNYITFNTSKVDYFS